MREELLKLANLADEYAGDWAEGDCTRDKFERIAEQARALAQNADGRGEGVDTRLHNLLSAFDKIAGIAQRHAGTVDAIEERGGEEADDPMEAIHYIAQNAYGDWRELYGRQKVTLTSTEPPTTALPPLSERMYRGALPSDVVNRERMLEPRVISEPPTAAPINPSDAYTKSIGEDAGREEAPTKAMLIAARDWSNAKYGKPIGDEAAIGCWNAMRSAQLTPAGGEDGRDASLRRDIVEIYQQMPALPITAETMDAATDVLTRFCIDFNEVIAAERGAGSS